MTWGVTKDGNIFLPPVQDSVKQVSLIQTNDILTLFNLLWIDVTSCFSNLTQPNLT